MERELWQLSAVTLAAMIRDREVSSLEVVDAHLVRIDAVNARVNAVVEVRPDEVRAEARCADRAVHDGAALGALHGVPFTVKTNIDVAGYATTEGTVALRDVVADTDAPQVEHMRRAGAIVLARTNMPDLGLRVNTESSLYGATHNPWRRGVTAGGSSGGEACAIATGMSPMGLGNDLGGSLRNPAFACGIASIKPSRGRVPQGNRTAPFAPGLHNQAMSVEGVLARHVGDVRAGLEARQGVAPLRPPGARRPPRGAAARPALRAGARAIRGRDPPRHRRRGARRGPGAGGRRLRGRRGRAAPGVRVLPRLDGPVGDQHVGARPRSSRRCWARARSGSSTSRRSSSRRRRASPST